MTRSSTINRTTRLILILYGIWPGTPGVIICRAYWIIALMIDEFCHYRYFLTHMHSDDLFDLMDCFSSFLGQIKVLTKVIVFWLNQQKFIEILTMMTEDWHDSVDNDVSMRETTRKAKLSDRIIHIMLTLHASAIVAYSIGVFSTNVDFTDRETDPPLLLKVVVPIDMHSQLRYKLLLTAQFMYLMMAGCGTGLLNGLLLTLTLHIGGQMDILRSWLIDLVPKDKSSTKRESIVIMTNKIIQKHQKIINFSEYIEDLYTYIALIHFVSNTIMICSLGFLMITAIGSPDATEQIIKSLLFYTVTNLEAFVFCFAGEYLKSKSKSIGTAAYNSAWYELKPKQSRVLLFIILRAQKQLTLTAGKIMDLSLASYASIIKASGSYISVLLAMQ